MSDAGAAGTSREAAHLAWAGLRTLGRAVGAESLRLRAMALTYMSLFALVPALVVAFSVVHSFAGMEALWRTVHAYLLDNLAVGARTSIEPYLDEFVRNAHATSAGLVGGALLIASAVTLFADVERALNEIWAVRRRRPLAQRVLVYWAGLTLGPLLVAGSLALGERLLHAAPGSKLLPAVASVLLSSALFAALYLVIPVTRVRSRAAAAGGLVAGIAFELAKWIYAFLVARFLRFHAVYGSVATVPIFLTWIYVSWTILLFGARASFVVQHARVLLAGHAPEPTALGRELLAARVMLELALDYAEGRPPTDPGDIAVRLQTFGEPVREVVGALRMGGLVRDTAGGGLVPARPLDRITLADVRRVTSGGPPPTGGEPALALVSGILAAAEGVADEALSNQTLASICARLAPTGSTPPGTAAARGS